jgi:hypothetical protein
VILEGGQALLAVTNTRVLGDAAVAVTFDPSLQAQPTARATGHRLLKKGTDHG